MTDLLWFMSLGVLLAAMGVYALVCLAIFVQVKT